MLAAAETVPSAIPRISHVDTKYQSTHAATRDFACSQKARARPTALRSCPWGTEPKCQCTLTSQFAI
jgi:hypothetical protein